MYARWLGGVGGLLLFLVVSGWAPDAHAQYKSYTFGFEGGYLSLSDGTELKPHNIAFGMFGSFKQTDNWWFSSKAMASFPGQLDNAPNTVVLLHVVPISVRYFFKTDDIRPYVGLTNSFQLLFNHTTRNDAMWGPGVNVGVQVKLSRDLFLGFEGDAFYMFIFQGPDAQVFSATSQLIFFL